MKRSALRRAAGACVVLSFFALLLGNGSLIGVTFAYFNGEVTNANSTFAGGWVGAASNATVTPSGYDMSLAWTPGTHGPVTGEQLYGVDNLTNQNCTGAAYTLISTLASASTSTYSDASRGTAANDGDWFCYEIVSTSATAWTTPLALPAVQLGLVANGLATASGSTAGSVSKSDTVTITFNQQTTLANSSNVRVCVFKSATNVILLGDTANCVAATDTTTIGKLTLSGATLGSNVTFGTSTVTVTTSAPWQVTVTLAGSNSTSLITGTPAWTFVPASTIKSQVTTHQATICSTATTNCAPTATTSF